MMDEQTDEQMDEPETQPRAMLSWGSLTLVLLLACVRVMSDYTPFPWWDTDPFAFAVPATGLTPTWSLAVNFLMIAASVGVVWGAARVGGRVLFVPGVCIAVAEAAVLIHAMRDLNTLMPGMDFIAAACAGYACWHATQLPKGRAVIGGVTLGLVCVLAIIGAHQVFVQHPQTVALYEADKAAFLASQGWAPGSFQALTFERRLMQPDPTAWFGLSNVFASVVGAMTLGLAVLAWRERRSKLAPICFIGALLGTVLVVLSRSTGAMGAMAITLGLLGLCAWRAKLRLGVLTVCASVGVVGAVIARGFVGERIGELSILFRSQYMQGAARIYGEHPIIGVGAGNFQSNYARLKPPTSPEDVSSPHSIAFDFISTLGIGGMALLAVFVMMVWSISPRRAVEQLEVEKPDTRLLMRVLGLVVLMSSALSIRLAMGSADLEIIGVQLLGMIGWGLIAFVVATRIEDSIISWAMGGVAAVLFVHGQLDLTPTFAVSAALFAVMIGGAGSISTTGTRKTASRATAILLPLVLGISMAIGTQAVRIVAWDQALGRGGSAAHEAAKLHQQDPLDPALAEIEHNARILALNELLTAKVAHQGHNGTWIAYNEQFLLLSTSGMKNWPSEPKDLSRMLEMALDGIDGPDARPSAKRLRWAGTLTEAIGERFPAGLVEQTQWREKGIGYWTRAAEMTPHDPNLAAMIMDGHLALDDQNQARKWAIRALEINERMHLDPLRQFDEQTLTRVRKIADQ